MEPISDTDVIKLALLRILINQQRIADYLDSSKTLLDKKDNDAIYWLLKGKIQKCVISEVPPKG